MRPAWQMPASLACSLLMTAAVVAGQDWALYEWAIATAMQAMSPPLLPLTSKRVAAATFAMPTMLSFAPPMPYYMQGSADTLLLAADEAGALRLLHADSATCVGVYATPSLCSTPGRLVCPQVQPSPFPYRPATLSHTDTLSKFTGIVRICTSFHAPRHTRWGIKA